MSKLDYVTIAIVAICILAIVFLVYKMTDLFGGSETTDTIENTSGKVETEGDTYDLNADPDEDLGGDASSDGNATTSNPGAAGTTGTTTTKPNTGTTTQPDPTVEGDDEENEASTTTRPTSSYNSAGKYMVIAGTFTQKSLAEKEAARLRGKGYENAKVEIFDRGKYAVVLVDRFSNMADAERLTNKLNAAGVKAFVKTKERGQ